MWKIIYGDILSAKFVKIFFICIFLIIVILVAVGIFVNADCHTLICDQNGDFTILVVSDPQCDTEKEWQEAKCELEILVEKAEPDFVLINGDMNSKNQIPSDMWHLFISVLEDKNVYWSTTNGNHDPFRYESYKMYTDYSHCLNATVSPLDKNYEYCRPMNYCIPICANDGKEIVFAVYGMDSGTSSGNGYIGVTEKQINWYKEQSENLKQKNNGKTVTSLMCMHIPLPQTLDMYYSNANADCSNGENCGGMYTVYGIANEPKYNSKGYLCENGTSVSKIKVHTSSKSLDKGMFDAILNLGDVKAVIFGHDHCTNIIGSYKGVLLGFAGKLSTGCYSDTLCRGGRVIKFNQSQPQNFTTEWIGSLESSQNQPLIYSNGERA